MEFEFAFEYDKDDFRKGISLGIRQSRLFKVRYLVLIFVVVWLINYLTSARSASIGGVCYTVNLLVFGAVGIGVFIVFGPQIIARLQGITRPKPGELHRWTLNESGIKVVNPHSTSEVKWSGFTKLVEDHDYLLLYYSKNVATVLPKRVIPGSIKEQVLSLIRSNVKNQNPGQYQSE